MKIEESIEDVCRRLVRLLPADYREQHGEDLVTTLVDTADERGVLPLRERLGVLALAVRLRVVTPLSARTMAALVTLLLLFQAQQAPVALVSTVWGSVVQSRMDYDVSLWWTVGAAVSSVLWVIAFVAWLYGKVRSALWSAALAVLPLGIGMVDSVLNRIEGRSIWWVLGAFVSVFGSPFVVWSLLALLALSLGVTGGLRAPGRVRWWLVALPICAVVFQIPDLTRLIWLGPLPTWEIWLFAILVWIGGFILALRSPVVVLASGWAAALTAVIYALDPPTYTEEGRMVALAALATAVVLAACAYLGQRRTPSAREPV
ncbi:hypothetical protein GCM10012275_46040 [Longimycelium tulufanense]|uniref:Uncharacterized protein n=1 Tax=Longimycelium tulufanense TaxID=907463 RepID=A0A8J3FVP2_9PSEU|nr:hypothetical protein [Longimycelium tulufanense]GGM70451.1 hypothetical protein GCM10012275_46040 [Longimycelium tulufanense]